MAGLLISFDGLDSSGKATQSRRLFSHIAATGARIKKFESPDYSTPSGKELKLRLQGKLGDWHATPWQEKMRYFADNRTAHKDEVLDMLSQGGVVIYDRYVPSSIAFMVEEAKATGEDRKAIHEAVRDIEYNVNGMPRENISLFFDIPPQIAVDLLEGRKGKKGEADEFTDHISVQNALHEEYIRMCEEYPDTMIRIKCMDGDRLRGIDEIAQEVRTKLGQTFPEHVSFFA